MNRELELAYQGEIHDQALLAHRAYGRIRAAVSWHRTPEAERRPPVSDQELVAILHESVIGFLDACAVISRFFNPAPRNRSSPEGRRALVRGQQLMHSVEAELNTDAFMPRDVRNAMEHIDEKMDGWLSESPPIFKHTWVVIWSGTGVADRVRGGLRMFNAESMEVRVLDEPANIERMHEALVLLDQGLEATTSDMHLRAALRGEAGDALSVRSPMPKNVNAPPEESDSRVSE